MNKLIPKHDGGGRTVSTSSYNEPLSGTPDYSYNGIDYYVTPSGLVTPGKPSGQIIIPQEVQDWWNDKGHILYQQRISQNSTPSNGRDQIAPGNSRNENTHAEDGRSGNESGTSSSGQATLQVSANPIQWDPFTLDNNILFYTQEPLRYSNQTMYADSHLDRKHAHSVMDQTGYHLANPEFNQLSQDAIDYWSCDKLGAGNCAQTTRYWDTNHIAPYLPGLQTMSYIDEHIPGGWEQYNLPYAEKGKDSFDTWEKYLAYENSGLGQMLDLREHPELYDTLPVGTIIFEGNPNVPHYNVGFDPKGRPRPTHTYIRHGYTVDGNGKVSPVNMDYGMMTDRTRQLSGGYVPLYAFVRNGTEELTPDKMVPRYLQYRKDLDTYTMDGLLSETGDTDFLKNVDPKMIVAIAEKYGMPREETFRRLMAIGQKETELGSSGKYMLKQIPGSQDAGKAWEDFWTSESGWDTMPGWQRELEVYNEIKNNPEFQGKSDEEIYEAVKQLYNQRAEEYAKKGIAYGKIRPNYHTANSQGYFQQKPDENDFAHYTKFLERFGKSSEQVSEAYNKMGIIYQQLKQAHPDWTPEQILNAVTVSWNAPSKIGNKDYLDAYILGNSPLKDDYLEKVLNFEKQLYPSNRRGGRLIPKPKLYGKTY